MAENPLSPARKMGLPPGSAIYIGERRTSPVTLTLTSFSPEFVEIATLTAELPPFVAESGVVNWLDIVGLHDVSIIEEIGHRFNLHPLTVEDILNTTQRPKLDIYDDYLFVVVRMPTYNKADGEIGLEQVSMVITNNLLLTFQERGFAAMDSIRARITGAKGRIRRMGSDYLAHSVLDAVVDCYFSLLEQLEILTDDLEEEVIGESTKETIFRIHKLKTKMTLLRKSVWPLRDLINSLYRDDLPFISDAAYPFLKDLADHTIQIIDSVETLRDIITGLLDVYLSTASNRMNEVMKVLTIFAAIFIPLTFIAGLYGMNFNTAISPYNMPELNWVYGYPGALLLMLAVAVGMVTVFRKRGWF
ncbi:MAG: magnesium/cobalt transporter CorA [Proteobacteria bacterium]|nr:magnesium/cobalt transporter CorA [Desulfobulbaceae bacterium]MBU4153441.1 magnesium/cobalt transporter CorA [Pseudomonadota bacterium]